MLPGAAASVTVVTLNPATSCAAKAALMAKFELSEIQAQAILDMRLARLTGLERDKILAERRKTRAARIRMPSKRPSPSPREA